MTIHRSEQLEDLYPEELLLGLSAPGLQVVVSAQIYSTHSLHKSCYCLEYQLAAFLAHLIHNFPWRGDQCAAMEQQVWKRVGYQQRVLEPRISLSVLCRFKKQHSVLLWLCFQHTTRWLAPILEHFYFRPFPTFMPACLPDAIDGVFKEIITIF